MEIDTRYAVQKFFPSSSFVQVYFEAVANAFDAGADDITISIVSDGQISPEMLVVTIQDNGQGFTDERYDRFCRLQEPQDSYHKGVGRLVYLHYFRSVKVESVFEGKMRTFIFSEELQGDSQIVAAPLGATSGSVLEFREFYKGRLRAYTDLKPSVLKEQIIESFLPLLHKRKKEGRGFTITILLENRGSAEQSGLFSDQQVITSSDVPDFEYKKISRPDFGMFSEITMSYLIQEVGSKSRGVATAVSVDDRALPISLIPSGVIPLGYSAFFLFESDMFIGSTDSSRQKLVLPESVSEKAVNQALMEEVAAVLSARLPQVEERNSETRKHFEDRYPHLVGLFDEKTVGLIDKEEALERAQRRFLNKQRQVLEGDSLDEETFKNSLELSSRTLTEYILYREFIIKKLAAISADDKEETIHNLIVPQRHRFDDAGLLEGMYSNNAWILDDKFMTFRTILSEARMEDIIDAITLGEEQAEDGSRPDISMIFSADPAEVQAVDVVIVEVKRRTANEKENTFAGTQLTKRARKLINHCPKIQQMWYFGLIEIDDATVQLLVDEEWTPLFSRGRVFYRDRTMESPDGRRVTAPMYLLSFDAVITPPAILFAQRRRPAGPGSSGGRGRDDAACASGTRGRCPSVPSR